MKSILLIVILALVALASAELTSVTKCQTSGGQCADKTKFSCSTGFKSNMCDGDRNNVCCTGQLAVLADANVSKCEKAGGSCIDNTKFTCSKALISGMCPGAASMQCCKGTSSPIVKPTLATKPPAKPVARVVPRTVAEKIKAFKPQFPYSNFETCYPVGKSQDIKENPVGLCNHGWIENTCAVRMSYTMNCVAKALKEPKLQIPVVKDQIVTACKGAFKGSNIIFRTRQLEPIVRSRLGFPVIAKPDNGAQRGINVAPFKGVKGMIYFDTTGAWDDATGHFDLWNGNAMHSKAANGEGDDTTTRYFGLSKAVYFWPLK